MAKPKAAALALFIKNKKQLPFLPPPAEWLLPDLTL